MVNEDAALLNRRVTHMTPAALFSRRLQLENAFGTCLLEHLYQIKAERVLRPFLSNLAREKTHA